ncbi:MAG: hypothetical protein ACRCS9_03780 [Hyphomicrobium sp.]
MNDRCVLTIRRGTLYFTGDVYERFFDRLDNVVLVRDGSALVVLPVRNPTAGGYVMKLRTAAGDRAVQAADFFRDNGIDDDVELTLPATWIDARAALIAPSAFD